MVSYELVKHQNNNTLNLVKKELKNAGFQNLDFEFVVSGRNSMTIKDGRNDLFIKVYSNKNLLLNCLYAQQIIEAEVPTPELLYHLEEKNGISFAVWRLVSAKEVLNPNKVNSNEIGRIAESICKIHSFRNMNKFYGPHIPINERKADWEEYLKLWTKSYIVDSRREIDGINKNTVYSKVQNYIDILPDQRIPSVLLHGDINISNFMLRKKHIYVTDLDYSIFGDPAWEFASAVADWTLSGLCYNLILSKYLKIIGLDSSEENNFLKRVGYYGPIKKIGLLYMIKDISGVSEAEEVDKSLKEIRDNSSLIKG